MKLTPLAHRERQEATADDKQRHRCGRNALHSRVNPRLFRRPETFRRRLGWPCLGPRAGGAGPGYLARYRVDWAASALVTEASLGGEFGSDCYYMSQVAPLAATNSHIVGGGFLVKNLDTSVFNVPPGFPSSGLLETSYGWGHRSQAALHEVIGLHSLGDALYVLLRRYTNEMVLCSLSPTNGAYSEEGFMFGWAAPEGTTIASDGDAMAEVPPWTPPVGTLLHIR